MDFAIASSRRQAEITWPDLDEAAMTCWVCDAKHPRQTQGNHKRFKLTHEVDIIRRQPRLQGELRIYPASSRHVDEKALDRANNSATPERMIRRMVTVEPTFATLKRWLNKGRLTCWSPGCASSEYSPGVLSYNLMRAINVLGVKGIRARLA